MHPAIAAVAVVVALIGELWGLIYKLALVIFAILVVVFVIKGCAAGATLNEHSSCGQFEQADADAQNKVLQDMMTAHHDTGSIQTARFSLTLYCNVEGQSAPIDGIYSGGNIGRQTARAVRDSAPLTARVSALKA